MKTYIIAFFLTLVGIFQILAAENDAIYCWVEDSYTCYQLSQYPIVTYQDSCVVLTIATSKEPVLSIPVTNGRKIKIVYGIYKPSSVDESHITPISSDGKYIRGGQLIIVKDGRKYDINGMLIQ